VEALASEQMEMLFKTQFCEGQQRLFWTPLQNTAIGANMFSRSNQLEQLQFQQSFG
jgi:hypothetical protein